MFFFLLLFINDYITFANHILRRNIIYNCANIFLKNRSLGTLYLVSHNFTITYRRVNNTRRVLYLNTSPIYGRFITIISYCGGI